MTVRAKFKCYSVTKTQDRCEIVEMQPVTTGSDPNKAWSKYTPSGKLTMQITAEGAQGVFQPGAEYYLDITPAE